VALQHPRHRCGPTVLVVNLRNDLLGSRPVGLLDSTQDIELSLLDVDLQ
jgi:hypothetical protein